MLHPCTPTPRRLPSPFPKLIAKCCLYVRFPSLALLPRQPDLLPVLFQCQLDALFNLLDHLRRAVPVLRDLLKALNGQEHYESSPCPQIMEAWGQTGRKRQIWARPSSICPLWSGVHAPSLRDNGPSVSSITPSGAALKHGILYMTMLPLAWHLPLALSPSDLVLT